MTPPQKPAIAATEIPGRGISNYPKPFSDRVKGRYKIPLGDYFDLTKFGINQTSLAPGSQSALLHRHRGQDELIYILVGHPTLVTELGEQILAPGMVCGFKADNGIAHMLVNRTDETVIYLEIGDRSPGDQVTFPNDDLVAVLVEGKWQFEQRDGTPYPAA
ncbi:MAG: cupin domain-containing protein [Candidatus Pacebacteria bacterium]|nr:cupin domain-containing protein [Candidatus Paceibacterota bacterium]